MSEAKVYVSEQFIKQQAETIHQLQARVDRLAELLEKIKKHGQFFYSAIELDHDIDGEALEIEVDQVLSEQPARDALSGTSEQQTIARIQADFLQKIIDECPEILPGETNLWAYLYSRLDEKRQQANQ